MDRLEIVVPRASGEAVFWGILQKMAFVLGIERTKMFMKGGPSMHFKMALPVSKEWGDPHSAVARIAPRRPRQTGPTG